MNKFRFIMLVDDNEIDTLINKRFIEMFNMADDVKSFTNGMEAINTFRLFKQIEVCPDLIFLDLSMPIMDGFEFLEEYRQLPEDMQKGKVIVLSSSSDPNDLKKAKDLGCADYILKPLNKDKINKSLERIFSGRSVDVI